MHHVHSRDSDSFLLTDAYGIKQPRLVTTYFCVFLVFCPSLKCSSNISHYFPPSSAHRHPSQYTLTMAESATDCHSCNKYIAYIAHGSSKLPSAAAEGMATVATRGHWRCFRALPLATRKDFGERAGSALSDRSRNIWSRDTCRGAKSTAEGPTQSPVQQS